MLYRFLQIVYLYFISKKAVRLLTQKWCFLLEAPAQGSGLSISVPGLLFSIPFRPQRSSRDLYGNEEDNELCLLVAWDGVCPLTFKGLGRGGSAAWGPAWAPHAAPRWLLREAGLLCRLWPALSLSCSCSSFLILSDFETKAGASRGKRMIIECVLTVRTSRFPWLPVQL